MSRNEKMAQIDKLLTELKVSRVGKWMYYPTDQDAEYRRNKGDADSPSRQRCLSWLGRRSSGFVFER